MFNIRTNSPRHGISKKNQIKTVSNVSKRRMNLFLNNLHKALVHAACHEKHPYLLAIVKFCSTIDDHSDKLCRLYEWLLVAGTSSYGVHRNTFVAGTRLFSSVHARANYDIDISLFS